ncbi:MAG: GTP 3',8-cyclase MoaA [Dehalococcoidales bacterium]|nr:GTP 3',8-cyclase MoaA [Dehalococcoidales bacterium]
MTGLFDSWQRQINYLRISVTDRCNLNCIYCSAGSVPYMPRNQIPTYEEIRRVVQVAAGMGITKVRLTGGEPLMRSDLSQLVGMLARIEGIDDIALTTNGTQLRKYAIALKEAGLKRVNVSLDTLKRDRFKRITGKDKLREVLAGIEAAEQAGLNPVKINMVVLRGINDDEIIDFARKSLTPGWHVRFIEFMPFETASKGVAITVPTQEIQEQIQSLGKLEPYVDETGGGPAKYFRLPGAKGTIGFISAMTEHFCRTCNRLRLTADGQLRPCLLDDDEIDLREVLRNGASPDELKRLIQQAVTVKRERHHLNEELAPEKRPMRQIGG